MLSVRFTNTAFDDLKTLKTGDPSSAKLVSKKIHLLRQYPDYPASKKLKGYDSYRRMRAGDYRIIYEYDDKCLDVILIGHRNNIYDRLQRLKG